MEIEEIFKTVSSVIEKSIGVPEGSIGLNDTLFDKLHVDSIDLVDILFELETAYKIPLKVSDVEIRVRAEMQDRPYEVDGVITEEGLESLKKYMPEIDPEKFQPGLTIHQLVQLFTVLSLCKMIQYKLEEVGKERKD
jgi:acyl carrier protein